MKKFLALILALFMLLTLAACGDSDTDKDDKDKDGNLGSGEASSIKLVEEKSLGGNVYIMGEELLGQYLWENEETTYKFADINGKITNIKEYSGYMENLYYKRYVTVTPKGVRTSGILDSWTGQEITPCDAMSTSGLGYRYEMFYYSTGETTQENAFNSVWDENGNTIYYTGYAKIFDYELGRFVPNLTITERSDSFGGNMSFIFEELEDGRTRVYDCNGEPVGTYYNVEYRTENSIFLAEDTFIDYFHSPDEFIVIGAEGSIISRINNKMQTYDLLPSSDKFLVERASVTTTEQEYITDLNGNHVSGGFDGRIYDLFEDKYVQLTVMDEDSGDYLEGICNLDNSPVVPCRYNGVAYYDGYFVAQKGRSYDDSKFTLFDATGKQIGKKEYARCYDGMLYTYDEDKDKSYVLFLNGTEKAINYYVGERFGDVIAVGTELYDVNTGKKLMGNVANYTCIDGKYYVSTNAEIIVYTIK